MEVSGGGGSHPSMNRVGAQEVNTAWANIEKAGDGGRGKSLNRFSLSLDSDQKDQLIEVIEKLLADKTTVRICAHRGGWWKGAGQRPFCFSVHPLLLLSVPQLVAGSVVMAFEEVCPERIDLIHKNYRKLCNLLIDVEEWGQVVIISMLTRYARTQFLSPTQNVSGPGPPGETLTLALAECAGGSPRGGAPWPTGLPLRNPCWRRTPRKPSTARRTTRPRARGRRRRLPRRCPPGSPMSWTPTTGCCCATPSHCCKAAAPPWSWRWRSSTSTWRPRRRWASSPRRSCACCAATGARPPRPHLHLGLARSYSRPGPLRVSKTVGASRPPTLAHLRTQ